MIELREDGSMPGPDQYGRLYKGVNPMTGEVGYSMWASEFSEGDPERIRMIEGYDAFAGYASGVLPIEEANALVRQLNNGPKVKEETAHTRLVKRVRQRLVDSNIDIVDGFTALQDMAELVLDIDGRRVRPALPGWGR